MNDKITFSGLVKAFADKHEITQAKSEQFIRQIFDFVIDDLEADGKASITNFGVFELKEVSERTGVNPQTGEEIVIPAHNKVAFRPYKALEESVNAEFGHLESRLIQENEDIEKAVPAPVAETNKKEENFDDPFGLDEEDAKTEEEKPVAVSTKDEDEENTPPPVYKANPNERSGGGANWILIILLLIVAATGIWYFFLRGDSVPEQNQVAENNAEQVEETQPPKQEPVEELQQNNNESVPEEAIDNTEPDAQEEEVKEAPKKPAFSTYIVERDEWMWDISREVYGEPFLWPLIFEANKTVNNNPDLVEPSNTLMVPGLEGSAANLTKGDFEKLAVAAKMVSDAYANSGNQTRAAEYLRFSKKYERNSRD